MSNVYSKHSYTLINILNISKNNIWYLRVTQRTPTYASVFGTYMTYALRISTVYQRLRAYENTLAYADAIRGSVTALETRFEGNISFKGTKG